MSCGYGFGDTIAVSQLAWKAMQNARKACGQYHELTRDLRSLHAVLNRLTGLPMICRQRTYQEVQMWTSQKFLPCQTTGKAREDHISKIEAAQSRTIVAGTQQELFSKIRLRINSEEEDENVEESHKILERQWSGSNPQNHYKGDHHQSKKRHFCVLLQRRGQALLPLTAF
jgi:hypothetical protein